MSTETTLNSKNAYSYIGWISNLQGKLFFNLFDAYGFRYDKTIGEIFFYKDKNNNLFFWSGIIDFRDSQDNKNSKKQEQTAKDSQNCIFQELRCFFIAKKTKNDINEELKGKFFIVLKDDKNKVKTLYKFTINKNNNYNEYLEKIRTFDEILELDIVILQNGIIKIITNTINKNIFENNQKNEEYFFLNIFLLIKSLFHKDRFHHKRNEHINLVVKSEDEKEALKKFVFFIQKYIAEERKKFENNIILYNLIGITNYLLTLLYIIKKYDKDWYKNKIILVNHLRNSLKDEKKEESKITNLIVSASIASLSLVGVYKILEINTTICPEKKKQILQSLIPNFIEVFAIFILAFVFYDYIKTRAIPFSLSNNPFLKAIIKGYNLVCSFLIRNTKPTIGTNFFTTKLIPYLRKKIRDLNLKIYKKK
jgi:hypothetical protein